MTNGAIFEDRPFTVTAADSIGTYRQSIKDTTFLPGGVSRYLTSVKERRAQAIYDLRHPRSTDLVAAMAPVLRTIRFLQQPSHVDSKMAATVYEKLKSKFQRLTENKTAKVILEPELTFNPETEDLGEKFQILQDKVDKLCETMKLHKVSIVDEEQFKRFLGVARSACLQICLSQFATELEIDLGGSPMTICTPNFEDFISEFPDEAVEKAIRDDLLKKLEEVRMQETSDLPVELQRIPRQTTEIYHIYWDSQMKVNSLQKEAVPTMIRSKIPPVLRTFDVPEELSSKIMDLMATAVIKKFDGLPGGSSFPRDEVTSLLRGRNIEHYEELVAALKDEVKRDLKIILLDSEGLCTSTWIKLSENSQRVSEWLMKEENRALVVQPIRAPFVPEELEGKGIVDVVTEIEPEEEVEDLEERAPQ
jgi:hypothetical protein